MTWGLPVCSLPPDVLHVMSLAYCEPICCGLGMSCSQTEFPLLSPQVSVVAHPQGSAISAAPASKTPLLQQSAPSAHKAQPAETATDTAAQSRPDRENKPKERRQAVGAEVGRFLLCWKHGGMQP